MKVLLCFVLTLAGAARADMGGECDLALFYLELGCTPASGAGAATATAGSCPQAFTCPNLHPDPTKCYYRGEAYAPNDVLPQNLIKNPCSQRCTCQVSAGEPRFECASIDCVETFDADRQQCVSTFELDSCCSVGNVCGKDAIAKLATCEVDGKTYREGESFEPKGSMQTCVCTAQWNGTSPASCRDINCGVEIHYQQNILDNCAPIFFKTTRSCPIAFKCPASDTKVVRGLNLKTVGAQCVFGNETLAVGDEVTVGDRCTRCACQVPPFVSCTQQSTCG